jgi:hypothetical protein
LHSQDDPRWNGHIPWFFRSTELGHGNFRVFFERVAQRAHRLLFHDEAFLVNLHHFGAVLETQTHQRFRYRQPTTFQLRGPLPEQIQEFFSPSTLDTAAVERLGKDPQAKLVEQLQSRHETVARGGSGSTIKIPSLPPSKEPEAQLGLGIALFEQLADAREQETATRQQRYQRHFQDLVTERLGVLEVLMRILPEDNASVEDFKNCIRGFLQKLASRSTL